MGYGQKKMGHMGLMGPMPYRLLPIAYRLLPIAYRLLPLAYRLLPIAYRLYHQLIRLCSGAGINPPLLTKPAEPSMVRTGMISASPSSPPK